MPMIDVYATAGTLADPHQLATDLAAAVMTIEQVPDIPMFRQNTAAFIHDLPAGNLSNVDGDANYVRIQVLTNAGALKQIIEAPSLEVVGGLDARTSIGAAVEAGAASDRGPDVHQDDVSAHDLGRFAESARFVRHYPEQNPVLGELLATITTLTQIVAGRDDDLVPWSNNQYLDDLLPNSQLHPLDAGHFAWEQAAEDHGRLVVDWVSGGYRRVAAG
jgi:pimeloyl-ACP methyl ester carboxylesterase